MRLYMAILALLNFASVLSLQFGTAEWLQYPVVFTTIVLFVDGVAGQKPEGTRGLRLVGGLFNFSGVIGGVVGNPSVLVLAVVGSILLISAHFGGLSSPPEDR